MNFLELTRKRESCRRYSDQSVAREKLEKCLEAARLAPSACNAQPWRFIVVDGEELKDRLLRRAFSGIYGMFAFAREAPVVVALVRERSSYAARLGGAFRGVQYSLLDVGIAGEHFVLQAAEEGLGTCWIGWFNERAVKKVLGLGSGVKVDVLIAVGYSRDSNPRGKMRKGLPDMSEFR